VLADDGALVRHSAMWGAGSRTRRRGWPPVGVPELPYPSQRSSQTPSRASRRTTTGVPAGTALWFCPGTSSSGRCAARLGCSTRPGGSSCPRTVGRPLTPSLHVWWRARPTEHPAFEEDDRVPNRRLDAAAAAGGGGTQDGGEGRSGRDRSPPTNRFDRGHGEVKKPRVPPGRVAREKRRRKTEAVQTEGGRFGQQTLGRSYWWRVYRVPALSMVMQARVPAGAYAHVPDLPQHLASLSSLLRVKG
jgi:hypothetical protein